MTDLRPTDEQQTAMDLFDGGLTIAVDALAGSGKTSLLVMMAEATRRRGQYVAFNTLIVRDAATRLPAHVDARTIHSVAFRAVGRRYAHRLEGGRVRSDRIARLLGVDPLVVSYGEQRKVLQPGFLAGLVMRSVVRFCESADPAPSRRHVPYIDGIDPPADDGARTWANNDAVRDAVEPFLHKAWADLNDPDGTLPYKHDHYLKSYELTGPRLGVDFLLVDEAQDLSPVMLSIVLAQKDCQLVLVGDVNQSIYCQPLGTMVRVPVKVGGGRGKGGPLYEYHEVPIETLVVGDQVVSWNRNWRNGGIRKRGCPITDIRTRQYDGAVVIAHVGEHASTYTPEHHCITLVGDALTGKHVVYMMRRGDQYRVGRCPWTYRTANNLNGVTARTSAEKADACWVLSAHDTAAEAALAEALTQQNFGIPGWCFVQHGNELMPIDEFWRKIGSNAEAAKVCLSAFGRLIDHPLWLAGDYRKFTRGPIVTAAANLMTGMRMLAADNARVKSRSTITPTSCWTPARIERQWYSGTVVSLSVDVDHAYIADGIVTHNSWRGAINAMKTVDVDARAALTLSFRFGHQIAEVANGLLAQLPTALRVRGNPEVDSSVDRLNDPRAVLCRTNAGAMQVCFEQVGAGRRPVLFGGGRQVAAFARAARDLMDKGYTTHPELACFDSWPQVLEYCLAPGTRVLTDELTWRYIEAVDLGDRLVGFEEECGPGTAGRRYRTAIVESSKRLVRPCWRLTMEDGTSVVASVEHRWLTRTSGNNVRWQQTDRLHPGSEIVSLGSSWERDDSRDGGWLAGMFDGEGWMTRSTKGTARIGVSQNEGILLERLRWALKDRGFEFGEHVYVRCHQLNLIGGMTEKLRFLGSIRPHRMLAHAADAWEGNRVEARVRSTVRSVEQVGEQEVIALQTSTRTYVAEGMLSHNCQVDPQGDELALMVGLVIKYGTAAILEALEAMPDEDHADVVVATAHAVKGRQWPTVKLHSDFRDRDDPDGSSDEELRLLYVAATRAQYTLDPYDCPPLKNVTAAVDLGVGESAR